MPIACTRAERLDLRRAGPRQRDRRFERVQQVSRSDFRLLGVSAVHRRLNSRINFGARVSLRGNYYSVQIENVRIPLALLQLNRKYLLALRLVRQVDKEQFIEPPL